ncbi:MAG: DUF6893 family small protein [Acidimicrobiales bacterium]
MRKIGMFTTLVAGCAGVAMTKLVIDSIPDLRRYLAMRSM